MCIRSDPCLDLCISDIRLKLACTAEIYQCQRYVSISHRPVMECMGEKTKQNCFGLCPLRLPVGQRAICRKSRVIQQRFLEMRKLQMIPQRDTVGSTRVKGTAGRKDPVGALKGPERRMIPPSPLKVPFWVSSLKQVQERKQSFTVNQVCLFVFIMMILDWTTGF